MIQDIIISIAAAAIGYASQSLRQPVILGYVLAGILIGPHLGFGWAVDPEAIDLISELGLIALLFMIGLHIDLKRTAQSGPVILIAGVAQFVLCAALGLAFFSLPLFSGGGEFAVLYLAVTFAFSSTMIVVKLLYDKFELDTLAGRITLSILVLQDIWAIVFLAIQPNLSSPEIGPLALSFLKGGALVGGALLASRFLLPYVFRSIARNTELVVVVALGWCFLFAWLSDDVAQLSRALGVCPSNTKSVTE